jgi:hypothetical protein
MDPPAFVIVRFVSVVGPRTWALTDPTAKSSVTSARITTDVPATADAGSATTFAMCGGVRSKAAPVVNCHASGAARKFPGSESSLAVVLIRTSKVVVASNRAPGVKVACFRSGDHETVPGIHAPSETRRTANELDAPLAVAFIGSDQLVWTCTLRTTPPALGTGTRPAIVGGVESISNADETEDP